MEDNSLREEAFFLSHQGVIVSLLPSGISPSFFRDFLFSLPFSQGDMLKSCAIPREECRWWQSVPGCLPFSLLCGFFPFRPPFAGTFFLVKLPQILPFKTFFPACIITLGFSFVRNRAGIMFSFTGVRPKVFPPSGSSFHRSGPSFFFARALMGVCVWICRTDKDVEFGRNSLPPRRVFFRLFSLRGFGI